MKLRLLLTCFLLLAATGCTQLLLRQTCLGLSTNVNYCLAPLPVQAKELKENPDAPKPQRAPKAPATTPAPTPKNQSQTQKVSIEINGKRHELLSQLELDGQRLSVVGLAPMGQPLFDVSFDGNQLKSEQSVLLGDNFRAEYLIALLQLIYWPEQELNAALSGGQVSEQSCPQRRCRILTSPEDGGIVHISYSHQEPWLATIILEMPSAGMKLKITPLA
ncbi:DUF3261 domain-containing protein [Shewanella zhangzhouensis]|uniref:DUF3261 domain-containing protein n=1 Tax=Shewanella zhangzhouensis TaxID=2864213 RepID=UPI001C65F050|nr:DUF3261 domain-containing protein [Shewanella zhangzhouensis]QYK05015.1 DUF3261 domain-containing protein [Shewanella zhangzhouensis]